MAALISHGRDTTSASARRNSNTTSPPRDDVGATAPEADLETGASRRPKAIRGLLLAACHDARAVVCKYPLTAIEFAVPSTTPMYGFRVHSSPGVPFGPGTTQEPPRGTGAGCTLKQAWVNARGGASAAKASPEVRVHVYMYIYI